MAEDYGLLSGLAKGLDAGMNAYEKAQDRQMRIKQYKDELEIKGLIAKQQKEKAERDNELDLYKSGVKRDEGGLLTPDLENPNYAAQESRQRYQDALSASVFGKEAIENARLSQQERFKSKELDLREKLTQAQIQKINEEAKAVREKGLVSRIAKEKPPTATQFNAAAFAKRMEQSEAVFNELEKGGFKYGRLEGLLSNKFVPGELQSEPLRKQNQAEQNFVNSILRKESGAAISPSEFQSAAQQYFNRPGDTPEVLEQKRANRLQVIESLKAEAANAYDKIPTVQTRPVTGGSREEKLKRLKELEGKK